MTRHRLPQLTLASLLGLAAILGFARPAPAAAQAAQAQWSGVERVVAFADVHGADQVDLQVGLLRIARAKLNH